MCLRGSVWIAFRRGHTSIDDGKASHFSRLGELAGKSILEIAHIHRAHSRYARMGIGILNNLVAFGSGGFGIIFQPIGNSSRPPTSSWTSF